MPNNTGKVYYILVGKELWLADKSGNLLENVTGQYQGQRLDPFVLASILRNIGRESTLTNWYWRIANYLSDRLDIRLKEEDRGTKHSPGESINAPETKGIGIESTLHKFSDESGG